MNKENKRLTVKNVKTMMGHDGPGFPGAWSCDFYLDGVKAGWALDNSWGGDLKVEYTDKNMEAQVKAFINSLPEEMNEFSNKLEKVDLEIVLSGLIDEWENIKEKKKMVKKGTWFRCKGDKEGAYKAVKLGKKFVPFTPQIKAWIVKTYPNLEEILNETIL